MAPESSETVNSATLAPALGEAGRGESDAVSATNRSGLVTGRENDTPRRGECGTSQANRTRSRRHTRMNVLLIGSGGREHALAWALGTSPLLSKLYCAPGNAGIAEIAECVALDAADHEGVIAFCGKHSVGLIVIGPEAPLVGGLA